MTSLRLLRTLTVPLLTTLAVGAAPAGASTPLAPPTISPAAGTPDASATGQISILGVSPSAIRAVTVTGSQSGRHAGALHAYSARRGASWVPSVPFTAGESVSATIRIAGVATIHRSFTIGLPAAVPPELTANSAQFDKLNQYASVPGLLPPKIAVSTPGRAATGDIFLTPLPAVEIHPGSNNEISFHPVGPGGPMIINGRGQIVWFGQVTPPNAAANFRPQTYLGRRVLTWWQGRVTIAAYGLGEGVIADTRYNTRTFVKAGNGYQADIHEFVLTPSGDALITAYQLVMTHLPGTPSAKLSPLLDSIVQEVDVRTGLVTWEWHSLGHIAIADSDVTAATSAYFDAFHLNSIELLPNGHVLVSARDTSSIYNIDRTTGRIVWTLGGKASSFRMGRGASFFFQHDAQMLPGNRVSLFDDEGGPPIQAPLSRGLVLALNMRRHTAAVSAQYTRAGTQANSQGSFQTLPNRDVLVGFGAAPNFTEFSPNGRIVFDGRLPTDDGTYRAFRYPWSATPTTLPALAAKRISPGQVQISASWNGATTVARWRVLGAAGSGALTTVGSGARTDFETTLNVNTASDDTFAVSALAADGHVLATSKPVSAS